MPKNIHFKLEILKRLREYLNLKKSDGVNYFCKCHFCNDHFESFCIPHTVATYRCFNCGTNGPIEDLFIRLDPAKNNSEQNLSQLKLL